MTCPGGTCRLPKQLALAAAILSGGNAVTAQVSPNGAEFQVNAYSTLEQQNPAVAIESGDAFVVVWQSRGSYGTDDSSTSIQARRFTSHGLPLGSDFQVNGYTSNSQDRPRIAATAQGGFVVVWSSFGSYGTDQFGKSIQARRYGNDGAALGPQFQVNSSTSYADDHAAIASDSHGAFVVVWESSGSTGGPDGSGYAIRAQRFGADGLPLGLEHTVNSYTSDDQTHPAIAFDGGGNYIVAWQSRGSFGGDTDSYSIQAQRYFSNGATRGAQFQVNNYTTRDQLVPGVAADAAGDFVIAWQSGDIYGSPDGSGSSIQARRYASDGNPLGTEFQVNSYTPDSQKNPSVAMEAGGGFLVSWESRSSDLPDYSGYSVQAQRFDAGGAPLGPQFEVNEYVTGSQQEPAATLSSAGDFLVTWQSDGSPGPDDDRWSIQAQRFDALFRDGFESGDASRWSTQVP